MNEDDKKDEGAPDVISEDDLKTVSGGRPGGNPVTVTATVGNDTITGIRKEDGLIRPSDTNFNIGMPPSKK